MSGPLLFIIVIAVVDLFLKSARDKKKAEKKREREMPNTQNTKRQAQGEMQTKKSKTGNTLRELRRSLEEEFDKQIGKVEDKGSKSVSKEVRKTQTPQERAREAERVRIEKQREKVDKHSELERSSRLQRDRMLTKSRLSDSQVNLASKDPNRKVDDYDLSTRKPISIELEDSSKQKKDDRRRGILDIREDILKGVIYSEILSQPKSRQRRDI